MTLLAPSTAFSPAAQTAAASRSTAIDVARGIAILLVVWGHAMIGVQRALGQDELGRFAVVMVYTVHMPLFFAVSGLLARRAMTEPAAAFARRLGRRIAYPYLLWSVILLAAHVLMSDVTNTSVDGFDPATILYRPPAVMWFLYVLGAALIAARSLRGRPASQRLALGVGLTIAGYLLDAWLLPHLRFVGIFLVATAITPEAALAATRDRLIVCLAAAALALTAAMAAGAPTAGYPAAELRYLPGAAAGIVLILALGQMVAGRISGAMAYLGARTMPIFVSHILVVAAVRILLLRLGVADAVAIVAIATVAGIAVPLLACAAATRLMIVEVLGWK